ncbi:hypothetical protein N8I77_010086 [Diaporthe amygdali]|uniref:Uncharacterized protein n=1 Tax=Phomopsis amygdali TaxID=1214568 RepID=A0AAD9S6M3_PHOAM|nr:hypothetical protein N8I77_010086 [Diaporthe amygdali]
MLAIWSAVQIAAALGRTSRERATAYLMKRSSKESGGNLNEMDGPYDSFEQSRDDKSTDKDLVHPQPSYYNHTEAYAFTNYPGQTGPQTDPSGIHVQRQFDMV